MATLTSQQLLDGLSDIGVAAHGRHTTPAYRAFTAQSLSLESITPLQHYPYLQHIRVDHNHLASLAPLSGCTSLTTLDASHNHLRVALDFIPPRALRSVNLSHNFITTLGGEEEEDEEQQQLAAIQEEEKESSNDVKQPNGPGQLLSNPHLISVDLSVNRLQRLTGIDQLPVLRRLNVSRNELGGIGEVSNPLLEEFDASGNFIQELESFAKAQTAAAGEDGKPRTSNIRSLYLDRNKIASLAGIEELTRLRALSLQENAIENLDEIIRLQSLPLLTHLDLRGCPLGNLPSYRHRLLHLLPSLHSLDGLEVTSDEVVDAHNEHGADQSIREVIRSRFLSQEEKTTPGMVEKHMRPLLDEKEQEAPLQPSTRPACVHPSDLNSTILPELQFRALLVERKFAPEWIEFMRLAKKRLVDVPHVQQHDGSFDDDEEANLSLDVSGVALGEAGNNALAEVLAVRAHLLHTLRLDATQHPQRWSSLLSDSYGLRAVLRQLVPLRSLRNLSLTQCHLDRITGQLLGDYLASPMARSTLRVLHLQHNDLGQNDEASSSASTDGTKNKMVVQPCPGLRAICAALSTTSERAQQPHSLEYLNLAYNNIDAHGARAIAVLLAGRSIGHASSNAPETQSQSPSHSRGGANLYDEDGDNDFDGSDNASSSSSSSVQLRTLILDGNPLENDGAALLANSLRSNTHLTRLSLRGGYEYGKQSGVVSSEGFAQLCHVISFANRSISNLDVGDNPAIFTGSDAAAAAAAADALSSLLFNETNGSNESGSNLKALNLSNTGVTDGTILTFAGSLARNSCVTSLNLGANPGIGEAGLLALFGALEMQGLVKTLDVSGCILGEKSALKAASWIRSSQQLENLYLGPVERPMGHLSESEICTTLRREQGEAEGVNDQYELDASAPLTHRQSDSEFISTLAVNKASNTNHELSDLARSTLSSAISAAQSHGCLRRLSLPKFSEEDGSAISGLLTELAQHTQTQTNSAEQGGSDEPIEPMSTQIDAHQGKHTLTVNTASQKSLQLSRSQSSLSTRFGGLSVLSLCSHRWDMDSFSMLSAAVRSHASSLRLIRLSNSSLLPTSDGRKFDLGRCMRDLLSSVIRVGSRIALLDLSDTQLGSQGLEGIGQALIEAAQLETEAEEQEEEESQGVLVAPQLQELNLSRCGVERFGEGDGAAAEEEQMEEAGEASSSPLEYASSLFLQALSLDTLCLSSLSLRGNGLSSRQLLRLFAALATNWNLRSLDVRVGAALSLDESSRQLVREAVSHAVQHGFTHLALPTVQKVEEDDAATVRNVDERDAFVAALADGWRHGVSSSISFLRSQGHSPDSVLHTLSLDLGATFTKGMSWKQKAVLAEALRPLNKATTATTDDDACEECFRLVALNAEGKPIQVNTKRAGGCGVDLVENLIAARLACQRV